MAQAERAMKDGVSGRTPPVEENIAACARGEHGALRLIYEAESARMLGVAMGIVKRRPLAEEAVHDTFVQIWRAAGTFDPERGHGRTWIYAILRHRALAILRDEARLDLSGEPLDAQIASDEDDPETIVTRLSEASALRRCLERLAPNRRAAIVLAYTHGLSHGELAGRLGLPLGTVKAWLRRSLVTLKACMS